MHERVAGRLVAQRRTPVLDVGCGEGELARYVRGEMGKPKSKRSSRGVPLAMRVAGALDDLHRQSAYLLRGERRDVALFALIGDELSQANIGT